MKCGDTYLNFNGNCEEASNFCRNLFGGEFSFKMRFSQMPSETQGMSFSQAELDSLEASLAYLQPKLDVL